MDVYSNEQHVLTGCPAIKHSLPTCLQLLELWQLCILRSSVWQGLAGLVGFLLLETTLTAASLGEARGRKRVLQPRNFPGQALTQAWWLSCGWGRGRVNKVKGEQVQTSLSPTFNRFAIQELRMKTLYPGLSPAAPSSVTGVMRKDSAQTLAYLVTPCSSQETVGRGETRHPFIMKGTKDNSRWWTTCKIESL